jgi:phosphatidylglycerol:prolipoprotein diacylglycerol transferase
VHPVLIDISENIKIWSFGAFLVLAFLVSAFYVRWRAHRDLGIEKPTAFNVCFAVFFIGLGGARLLYALIKYDEFTADKMKIFKIWQGGLVWYGGLIVVLLWLAWYLPRHPKLKGWALMDVLSLGACLAIFVGRWASFLAGENYGKEAPGHPFAVVFPPDPNTQAVTGVEVHPTQIYHSVHGLLLFLLLAWFLRRKPHPGKATGLFLVLYAVGRSIIEIWRGDDSARGMVIEGYVSTSQLISIPILFIGVAIFFARKVREDEYAP